MGIAIGAPFFPAGCHLAVRGYDVLVSAGVVQQSQHVAAIHLKKGGVHCSLVLVNVQGNTLLMILFFINHNPNQATWKSFFVRQGTRVDGPKCGIWILAVVLAHFFKFLILNLDIVFAFQTNHCILEATRSLKSQRSLRILEPSQLTPGVCHLDTLILKVYGRDQPKRLGRDEGMKEYNMI